MRGGRSPAGLTRPRAATAASTAAHAHHAGQAPSGVDTATSVTATSAITLARASNRCTAPSRWPVAAVR